MNCSTCGLDNASDRQRCANCGSFLSPLAAEAGREAQGSARPSRLLLAPLAPKAERSPKDIPTELLDLDSVPPFLSSPVPRAAGREISIDMVFSGRYRILAVLGEGGMGVVYKARDLELDKVIALKTIRGGEADPELVQRFKRELLLARGITHKNVVRIHDFGEAGGVKYFTMEYIEGESLKQILRRRGRTPAGEALPMIVQILSALQEAHDQGVIHRDLKPQNIMIDMDGVPHIMDFGIARSAMETAELTATGMVIGTPDYMSPEQVRGEKASPQSDLFSFGVILYELLTGKLPYTADTPVSKVIMRLSHKPRAPRQIAPDIPKYVERAILKCMEVDRELRYGSAREMLDDLTRRQVDRSLKLRLRKAVGRSRSTILAVAAALSVAAAAYLSTGGAEPPAAESALAEIESRSLAILPFTNATGSSELEWMRTGLPEMLTTDIAQSQFVRPVPGERVLKVMRELGVADNTRFDETALTSIAERAPADSVLYGQYVESGGELRLDLTLRKSSSGVPTPISLAMPAAEVFALVDSISAKLKEHLDLPLEALAAEGDRPIAEVATGSLDALRSYQQGLSELNGGSNQAAIASFQEAILRDPEFAMAYAKLAEAQFHLGQRNEAVGSIDRARRLLESASLPLVERYQIHATEALVKNEYETAARSLLELSEIYPRDPDIQLSLARAYEELGRLKEAQGAYQKVVRLAPHYGSALLGLGRIQVTTGAAAEAILSLNRALETGEFTADPETLGTIHAILGVAHRELGELETALSHLNLSLEAREEAGDPAGQASTLQTLSSIYEDRGDVEKALAAGQRALAIARELGDQEAESVALNNMGLTYQVAGNLDLALDAFRGSLRIEMERQDPARVANRLDHIANLYELQGRYDDAMVYLEQAKSHLEKSDDRLERSLNGMYIGRVRKAQGLYDEALDAFLEALALARQIDHPVTVASIQKQVADIYVNQGRYADALTALEQSLAVFRELEVEHDIAELKAPLAHLLIRLGRTAAAAKELERAERSSASIPELLLGRAEILDLSGKREEAAAAYEEANLQANLSGKKEIAVSSRIELGRLFLQQKKIANAERLLLRTKKEAADARLSPLEAEATAALAEVHLAKKDPEAARQAALEAIAKAEKYSGKPTLFRAYAALGRALRDLGQSQEAVEAHLRAAEIIGWIRGGLRPEHVRSFMARSDIRSVIGYAITVLEEVGRTAEAVPLRQWLTPARGRTSDASSPRSAAPGRV